MLSLSNWLGLYFSVGRTESFEMYIVDLVCDAVGGQSNATFHI